MEPSVKVLPRYDVTATETPSLVKMVPLSALETRLKEPAYELTGNKAQDLHRVYIDVDGETAEELTEAAFIQLQTTMTRALQDVPRLLDWGVNFVVMESCQKDNTVKRKGTKVNILSFRLHATHHIGTKDEIKAYVTRVLLPELKLAVTATEEAVVQGSPRPASPVPRLKVMLSADLAKLQRAGKTETGVFYMSVDTSVYSEARKMRMLGTCKPHDFTRPMRLVPAAKGQPTRTAVDTLITYVPSEGCERLPSADSYTAFDAPAAAAAAGKKRKAEGVPSHNRTKKRAAAKTDADAASDSSIAPLDEVDAGEEVTSASVQAAVTAALRSCDSNYASAQVRSIRHHSKLQRFTVQINGSRYCAVKGDQHTSNNVYFVISETCIEQRCHDDACCGSVKESGGGKNWPASWELLGMEYAEAFHALFPGRIYGAARLLKKLAASYCLHHLSAAELFALARPDGYVYHPSLGWYALLPSNVWQAWGKEVPTGLRNCIGTTIEQEADLRRGAMGNMEMVINFAGSSPFVSSVVSFLPALYMDPELDKKMDCSLDHFPLKSRVLVFKSKDGAFLEARDIRPSDYISITTGYDLPTEDERSAHPELADQAASLVSAAFETLPSGAGNDVRLFAQCCFADLLRGRRRYDNVVFLTGSGGNGKSLLMRLLAIGFGALYRRLPKEALTAPKRDGESASPFMAELRAARVVVSSEPEERADALTTRQPEEAFQSSRLKDLTGGDPITCRTLHGKPFTFTPQFTPFIPCNGLPNLTSVGDSITRRARVVQFPYSYVDQPRLPHERLIDRSFRDKLDDSTLKAFLAAEFIVHLVKVLSQVEVVLGAPPPAVMEATRQYLHEQDRNPVRQWLHENYDLIDDAAAVEDKRNWIGAADLHNAFLRETGTAVTTVSAAKFKDFLNKCRLVQHRLKTGLVWKGLRRKVLVDDVNDHAHAAGPGAHAGDSGLSGLD